MSAVNETLQQLVERRLLEMGRSRGGDAISLHDAYQALLGHERVLSGDLSPVSYEVFRRIRAEGHRRLSDRAADSVATMLGVSVQEVQVAAGQVPQRERFVLPSRADRLNEKEREAIVTLVDVILDAAEREGGSSSSRAGVKRAKGTDVTPTQPARRPKQP